MTQVRFRIYLLVAMCLLFVFSSIACQKKDVLQVEDERLVTCSDVHYSSAIGRPLDAIQLSAVPSDFGEFLILITTSATSEATLLTPVERAETGTGASFHVPVHPDMQSGGGEVLMTLLDTEGKSCQPVAFTIQALPESPGAYEQLAHLIVEMGEEQARILGMDTSLASAFQGDGPIRLLPFTRRWKS